MIRRNVVSTWATSLACAVLVGCMPEMTIEQMKEMRPERPVELDRLNMFAGTWEGVGEAEMGGLEEVTKSTSKTTREWACDGWCLVERGTMEFGDMGKMHFMGIWTWDAKSRKYRTSWADDFGSIAYGVAKYDGETRTWTIKAKSKGGMGKTVGKGTFKFVDDDTMEWSWTERAGLFGMFKIVEATGTDKRK